MTKLKLIKNEVDEETSPIEFMTGDESRNILDIMDNQQEMFLGGLNDELMSSSLGIYTETKEQFEKILKEWNKLYAMVEGQEANDK
jgi:hypothetical protein